MTRRRRSVPHTTGDALEGILDRLAPEDDLSHVSRAWARAVGPTIAAAARPVALEGATLHVAARDATWAHEIELLGPTVLARLADALGDRPAPTAIRVRGGG